MGELTLLRDLVVIFAVAVGIVALLKRVRVPPIAGFIVAGASERAAREARRLAPDLHITVRTRYQADVAALRAAGATEIVVGEVETAVETVRRALGRLGADPARVQYELALVRMGITVPPRDDARNAAGPPGAAAPGTDALPQGGPP
jgi:hypothetical protein